MLEGGGSGFVSEIVQRFISRGKPEQAAQKALSSYKFFLAAEVFRNEMKGKEQEAARVSQCSTLHVSFMFKTPSINPTPQLASSPFDISITSSAHNLLRPTLGIPQISTLNHTA